MWCCDWSSDVCSSDRAVPRSRQTAAATAQAASTASPIQPTATCTSARWAETIPTSTRPQRYASPERETEERRVGKEGRARGAAGQEKRDKENRETTQR